ncbi:UNVERIFIED_CONTAM: putative phosphoinositide phosphatase SAC9 [Sesamum radiatum]|uniref:Phosphoinositide phosphatase SAC9 n=1 Tax=Sesamum radiatum TaxID=300843 RepID=A0AAW2U9H4_SESRA
MPHEDENADHIADTFANCSDEGSEPDEVEFSIPPENGPNDVDINVIAEEFARGMSSSSEQIMSNRTTQQTYYRSIPFFDQTFPEIPADSVDVPTLKYAKFYNTNEGRLDVGMLFKNKEALIEAVKDHSARHARREYYVTESSKTKWKVLCKHSTPGQVKCNPTFAIKHVIQAVKDHTGYDIPYQKAWYSLKMAREIVYGTWESSVQKLPKYMGAVQKYNPGTIVEWKHKALHPTGAYVIGYVFWAFKPCIEGFKFCRNIISVDGTHLYTRYKHKMLIAATMDGNQQVLPLAFAIVDDESYASWKWFLQQLSRHVIRGRRGVCLISDRHAGIIKAVNESSEFVPPNGVHSHEIRSLATIPSVVTKRQQGLGFNTHVVKLANRNVHAANGINLVSLALTLKKCNVHLHLRLSPPTDAIFLYVKLTAPKNVKTGRFLRDTSVVVVTLDSSEVYIIVSLSTRTDTQVIYIDPTTGALRYSAKQGYDVFRTQNEALDYITNGSKLLCKSVTHARALLGYAALGSFALLLVATRLTASIPNLPGGGCVYTVTESQWIKISLQNPQVQSKTENKNIQELTELDIDGKHYFCETRDITRPFPSRVPMQNPDEFVWNKWFSMPFRNIGLPQHCVILLQVLVTLGIFTIVLSNVLMTNFYTFSLL